MTDDGEDLIGTQWIVPSTGVVFHVLARGTVTGNSHPMLLMARSDDTVYPYHVVNVRRWILTEQFKHHE